MLPGGENRANQETKRRLFEKTMSTFRHTDIKQNRKRQPVPTCLVVSAAVADFQRMLSQDENVSEQFRRATEREPEPELPNDEFDVESGQHGY